MKNSDLGLVSVGSRLSRPRNKRLDCAPTCLFNPEGRDAKLNFIYCTVALLFLQPLLFASVCVPHVVQEAGQLLARPYCHRCNVPQRDSE